MTVELPLEILQEIFTYVSTKDLDTLELVCKRWREVSGESLWKRQFGRQFGTVAMAPLSHRSKTWRNEFLMRSQVLHKWKKCHKLVDVTVNSTLLDINSIKVNFSNEHCKALCFNSHSGVGNVVDLQNGRIKLRFHSKHRDRLMPAACMDGSRFAIMYGFYDGRVALNHLHKDGTLLAEYEELKYRHEFAVSSVWIAKNRSLQKQIRRAVTYASGSHDGTIILTSRLGRASVKPTTSPVVLLEGTMFGSTSIIDGECFVSMHKSGELHSLEVLPPSDPTNPKAEPIIKHEKLAHLELPSDTVIDGVQLHLCNMFVVVQTKWSIYIVDIRTKEVTSLEIPVRTFITAFAVDMSHSTNKRFISAGLSNDTVRTWYLPEIEAQESNEERMEPKIIKLNTPTPEPTPEPEPIPGSSSTGASSSVKTQEGGMDESTSFIESRFVNPKPLWVLDNPTGYKLPEGSEKYPITQIAVNAAVVLVAGYNGLVLAYDVLSAKFLKKVNSRISKNALDLNQYSRDGLVPVTHLYVDPNPLVLRGVICVRPTLQGFDLGRVEEMRVVEPHRSTMPHGHNKKKSTKHKTLNINSINPQPNLREELFLHHQISFDEQQANEREETLQEEYGVGDLDQDEQMRYAMLLSEQHAQDDGADADAELARAIELSRLDADIYNEPSAPTEATQSSLTPNNEQLPANSNDDPSQVPTEDDDMAMAIALSLQLNGQ